MKDIKGEAVKLNIKNMTKVKANNVDEYSYRENKSRDSEWNKQMLANGDIIAISRWRVWWV